MWNAALFKWDEADNCYWTYLDDLWRAGQTTNSSIVQANLLIGVYWVHHENEDWKPVGLSGFKSSAQKGSQSIAVVAGETLSQGNFFLLFNMSYYRGYFTLIVVF